MVEFQTSVAAAACLSIAAAPKDISSQPSSCFFVLSECFLGDRFIHSRVCVVHNQACMLLLEAFWGKFKVSRIYPSCNTYFTCNYSYLGNGCMNPNFMPLFHIYTQDHVFLLVGGFIYFSRKKMVVSWHGKNALSIDNLKISENQFDK